MVTSDTSPFERVDEAIYGMIFNVALQSQSAYQTTMDRYNKFKNDNIIIWPNVKNVFYPMNQLENQYFKNLDNRLSIIDVMHFNSIIGLL